MQAQVKDHKQVTDEFNKEASSAGNSEVGQIDNALGQKQAQASQGQAQAAK
jgi:hypothetical protein